MDYLEVVGHIVVLATGLTQQRVPTGFSLV